MDGRNVIDQNISHHAVEAYRWLNNETEVLIKYNQSTCFFRSTYFHALILSVWTVPTQILIQMGILTKTELD